MEVFKMPNILPQNQKQIAIKKKVHTIPTEYDPVF